MNKLLNKLLVITIFIASFGLMEAATTVTINLNNSSGNPITSGATLSYYDAGWHTATDNGDGTFTANVNGSNIKYTMSYNHSTQSIITGDDVVNFNTVATTAIVKNSNGTTLSGGTYAYYGTGGWTSSFNAGDYIELLPGHFSVAMVYNNGRQQKDGISVSGQSTVIEYTTVAVTTRLLNCDSDELSGGSYSYYGTFGWSSYYTANSSTLELLPANYSFAMSLNGTRHQVNGVSILGSNATQNVDFQATQLNYTFNGGISYYANGWHSYTQGMYLMPGTYYFKFGSQTFPHFVVSGCSMDGNVNIFHTKKHDGSPLPNIPIYRNVKWSTYTLVGTTDANGLLFTTDQPDGSWKYRASKDYSEQYIISGPGNITFQTSEFVTHVEHTDGTPYAGIPTEYNTRWSSYISLDPAVTDANGNASIELFPGNYKFRASKDYSVQYKYLEITTPGTSAAVTFQTSTFVTRVLHTDGTPYAGIPTEYNTRWSSYISLDPAVTDANGEASIELFPGEYKFRASKDYSVQYKNFEIATSGVTDVVTFQTSTFVTRVLKHDGTPFAGIPTEYNTRWSSYISLDPAVTDANGEASIELFPGEYKFRASKDYSVQYKNFEIAASGSTDVVTFQTALAEANVVDCSTNTPIEGVHVEYNTRWSSYIDLNPGTTDATGTSTIELFPGEYKFRASVNHTTQSQTVNITNPVTSFTFNPVNVTLNYVGDVKFNYQWSSYMTVTPNMYMFPGTYKFRFYNGNHVDLEREIAISGCSVNEALIFVQLKDSQGNGLAGGDFDWRLGWGAYTNLGTDNTGSGFWAFVSGNPSNVKVRVNYLGGTQEKQQNIHVNPNFIFNTVNVTADLVSSTNSPLTADTWEYRYGWGAYHTFTNTGQEFLPSNLKVRVGYKGAKVEKQQNVGTNSHFNFNTVNVTAELNSSTNSPLTADTWEYRYGWEAYKTLNNTGEELLPVNVKVRVGYKGAKVEKHQNVNSQPHYVFNTELVTAELQSSTGNPLTADGWSYRYGWEAYKTLNNAGEELLPVNVKVKVHYKGACVEKRQNVNNISNFVFNTKLVTAELLSSTGATLTADNWQYRYGWGAYHTLDNTGEELLPVNTKVKVHYKGACVEKQQNVNSDESYEFNTVLVTADLNDANGNPIITGATWSYRYGWGAYHSLNNSGEELLPLNTKVKVVYNGASKEKQQNVNSDASYDFTWDGSALYKSTNEDLSSTIGQVKVYPNPSDGIFIIENIKNYKGLTIYDMTGRMIYSRELTDANNVNINLNNPVAGTYIIKLDNENGSVNTPLIIK